MPPNTNVAVLDVLTPELSNGYATNIYVINMICLLMVFGNIHINLISDATGQVFFLAH